MENVFQLDPVEARVLGVLIEKAMTTPDQYPLSLNALTSAVNQRVNREPVLSLDEEDVLRATRELAKKHLAESSFPAGGRVEKFRHKAVEMLGLGDGELAVLAELLLRGPPTPGELRTRASRMSPIESIEQLASKLAPLVERGYARRLPPAPGSRAERYAQLLSPEAHPIEASAEPYVAAVERAESGPSAQLANLTARVEALEAEVDRLREMIEALRR